MTCTDVALDAAALAAKSFQICSEFPVLSFLKPVAILVVTICENAKLCKVSISLVLESGGRGGLKVREAKQGGCQ